MNKNIFYLLPAILLSSLGTYAQTSPKGEKGEKTEKKEIIIEKKEGTKKEKMVIEIDGENVTINGKPAEEFEGKGRIIIDDDIVINGNVVRVPGQSRNMTITTNSSRPLLGVTTEKADGGIKITGVTKASGAEKAGLKEGDIITGINKTTISSPQQLSEVIGQLKVGDMIDVNYTRAGKPLKVKATLGKNSETYTINTNKDYNFKYAHPDGEPFAFSMPRMPEWDAGQFKNLFLYESGKPKYGMSIQDDEDNRGVLVTEVEEESNAAKAGLKEDDIITEIDGEKVKGVDDLKAALDSKKEQPSVAVKVLRNGKTESLTIKVPRKLKSASL
jgi:serine protease Do